MKMNTQLYTTITQLTDARPSTEEFIIKCILEHSDGLPSIGGWPELMQNTSITVTRSGISNTFSVCEMTNDGITSIYHRFDIHGRVWNVRDHRKYICGVKIARGWIIVLAKLDDDGTKSYSLHTPGISNTAGWEDALLDEMPPSIIIQNKINPVLMQKKERFVYLRMPAVATAAEVLACYPPGVVVNPPAIPPAIPATEQCKIFSHDTIFGKGGIATAVQIAIPKEQFIKYCGHSFLNEDFILLPVKHITDRTSTLVQTCFSNGGIITDTAQQSDDLPLREDLATCQKILHFLGVFSR